MSDWREEGIFVAARSSRGHLAHAIYVKDLDVYSRRSFVVAMCYGAETNMLVAESFDVESAEHGGHRTCQKCAEAVRQAKATLEFLRREARNV